MASGLWLSKMGYEWSTLQSVGEGLIVYDSVVGKVVLPSGFFRSPEVASWHCASAACIALILMASRRSRLLHQVLLVTSRDIAGEGNE